MLCLKGYCRNVYNFICFVLYNIIACVLIREGNIGGRKSRRSRGFKIKQIVQNTKFTFKSLSIMTTIQIVKNSDRCHVSIDGTPARTFLFSDYQENKEVNKEGHAIHDAMAECFLQLKKLNDQSVKAQINTDIITK